MNQVSESPIPKTDFESEILQQLDKIAETGNKFREQILELGEKLKTFHEAEGQKFQKLQFQSGSTIPDWMKCVETKLQEMKNARQETCDEIRELEKQRFDLQELMAEKFEDALKDVATIKSLTKMMMELKPKLENGRKITQDLESQIEKMKQELKANLDLLESATKSDQVAVKSSLEKLRRPPLEAVIDADGWIVIQQRQSGPKNEFERGWTEYENGFGSVDGNFWLGLKKIHELTADGSKELRVDWEGNSVYANYSKFSVGNSADLYRLSVGEYSGNAGNSFYFHNGSRFSTTEKKSAGCQGKLRGGWWKSSHFTNLNGLYYDEQEAKAKVVDDFSGVYWRQWKSTDYSLHKVLMKIRERK